MLLCSQCGVNVVYLVSMQLKHLNIPCLLMSEATQVRQGEGSTMPDFSRMAKLRSEGLKSSTWDHMQFQATPRVWASRCAPPTIWGGDLQQRLHVKVGPSSGDGWLQLCTSVTLKQHRAMWWGFPLQDTLGFSAQAKLAPTHKFSESNSPE